MPNEDQKQTHFGYQQVPIKEKANKVAEVFHSVADQYDIMNDLMSFGIHRLWKRVAVQKAGAKYGDIVLDLAGGTGDLAAKFSKIIGNTGRVILSDINGSMLRNGRSRLIDMGIAGNVDYVQANAECLPFPDDYFDIITIAFGLRNVTDKDAALRSMYRVLKPSGRLLVLEFSKPVIPGLNKIYDQYSFKLLPLMGKIVTNDADSYRYLAESIRMHPSQEVLKQHMLDAGFDKVDYQNMTGGIVALHKGIKY